MAKAKKAAKAPKSREQAKVETREAVIGAALQLFAERGFDAPSLDEICERAGFTRGAFYVHFGDRDALVTAAMEKVGRLFLDALLGADTDDLGVIAARFVEAVGSGAYPLTPRGGIRPYQLLQACARSPSIRAEYTRLVGEAIDRLGKATKKAQREDKLRKDVKANNVGLLLVSLVIGVQTLMDLGVEVDVADAAKTAMKLLNAPR